MTLKIGMSVAQSTAVCYISNMNDGPLFAAAETFALSPREGATTDSRTDHTTGGVYSPLKTTVLLLDDGRQRLCFITMACYGDFYAFSNLVRRRVGAILGIPREQIAVFSSHNHSCVMLAPPTPSTTSCPMRPACCTTNN